MGSPKLLVSSRIVPKFYVKSTVCKFLKLLYEHVFSISSSVTSAADQLEDALQHLLNYLFPNIFEISPHVINAVMEGIEGLRVALGAGRILLYTLQGMFHPARRVRDVYWKIYNNMYLGAQDSLVAVYPTFQDDPKTGNTYRRYELELMM